MKKEADSSKGPRSATSAAILGNLTTSAKSNRSSNGSMKVKGEWAKYYTNLLELREQLLKQNLMGRLGLLRDTGHSRKTPFTTAFYPEQSVLTFGDAASLSVTR